MSPPPAQLLRLLRRAPVGTELMLEAHGESMAPTIHSKEEVIVERAEIGSAEKGHIVAYLPDTFPHIVLHRVIRAGGVLTTKGDNAPTIDPWEITNKQFIGIARAIRKKNKRIDLYPHKKSNLEVITNKLLHILEIALRGISVYSRKFLRDF